MSALGELITKLEAAKGPDRRLDEAICESLGYEVRWDHRLPGRGFYEPVKGYSWQDVPAYTHSLDEALTLVPKGCGYTLNGGSIRLCVAELRRPPEGDPDGWWVTVGSASASTLAIALCIAALRARLAQQGEPA